MSSPFVWNVNPIAFHVGSLAVRYYGLFFGCALITAFGVWYHRVTRFGQSHEFAANMLYFGAPLVIIGGRLGHCLFYEPQVYLAHPLRMLAIWQGGMSSHGAALGLALALYLIARRERVPFLLVADYFVPAVALGVGWIRLGNFSNSEIVGRATSVPWAVVFARHDLVPRHPAQLYDFAIGPITWLVLRRVESRNARPLGSGLIGGLFLLSYFGLRIVVESYKDFFEEQLRDVPPFTTIEQWLGVPIHTGQWLSVPACIIGIIAIVRALRQPISEAS